jgi:hypothetical protein
MRTLGWRLCWCLPRVARPVQPCHLVAFSVSSLSDLVAHGKSFASVFALSSHQQNVIDAVCRGISHGTSVCVRSGRAADVHASLWLQSQLLLQIAAFDGCADGNPDDNNMAVSDKIVLGDGRP